MDIEKCLFSLSVEGLLRDTGGAYRQRFSVLCLVHEPNSPRGLLDLLGFSAREDGFSVENKFKINGIFQSHAVFEKGKNGFYEIKKPKNPKKFQKAKMFGCLEIAVFSSHENKIFNFFFQFFLRFFGHR